LQSCLETEHHMKSTSQNSNPTADNFGKDLGCDFLFEKALKR
jgi:hypothetical protein